MTSQVNPNNIDGTYPVAGQDNDSQGFRDNFTNIRNNLTYVKAEIEDIQNKAVLKSALTNTTLDNNFYGNIISNPSLSSWRETYNNIGAVSGSVTVNFVNGNFQKITMSGSTTLNFSWPSNTANQYASIKLWVSNPSASYTLTLPGSGSQAVTLGDPDTIAGLDGTSPPIITFTAAEIANNTEYLFEFFTLDGGTTIGIKDLIRNRDVDLSGLSITGNLIQSGGTVNSGYFYANVVNNQNLFANTAYSTFICNASPHPGTIANLRFTLPGSAEDGREITLRVQGVPVTTLFVSNGAETSSTGNTVQWIANNWSSSGNVTAKFVYNSTITRWMRTL